MSLPKLSVALVAAILVASGARAEAPKSPVPWETLASAKEATSPAGKSVEFGSPVTSLDHKVVAIKGFRVPLEQRTHFLIASKPSDCPDHIEDGPKSYVEVFSKEPVKPTFGKPLTVIGKLQLLRDDPGGVYYRLVDAELVSVD